MSFRNSLLFAALVGGLALTTLAPDAVAQRGGGRGRGRPEAILERVSCYLLDDKLPAKVEGEDRLAAVPMVAEAKKQHELAVVYLLDSTADAQRREPFENVMFGSEELGVALRCFHFARVDVAGDAEAQAKYRRRLPLFVAFDDDGKAAGEASLAGYKAVVGPVFAALEKAAGGHVKPTLAGFVGDYRGLVHDLEAVDQKRKALKDRQTRANEESKKAEIDKELAAVDAEEKKLLATEKELLERAKVVARDAGAKRFEVKRGR